MTDLLKELNLTTEEIAEIVQDGAMNVGIKNLSMSDDITEFYNKHDREINKALQDSIGVSLNQALEDRQAFEILINNIDYVDDDLSFSYTGKLLNEELPFIVMFAIEMIAYDYYDELSKSYLTIQ